MKNINQKIKNKQKFNLDYINNIINKLKSQGYNKNKIMAFLLKKIMKKFKITKKQYMIIAGYCLHKYKNVTDLDIIIEKGIPYNKLRNSGLFTIDTAKISKDERLVLNLKNINENAEMEFFPKSRKKGFPSNYYSLENLQSKKLLNYDEFGNPYYNEITCAKQYSHIKISNNGKFYTYKYEISKERIEKNILHLTFILNNNLDDRVIKYCRKKINYLKKIIN